ncbi:hypothetical protein BG844_30110 [Couchioplanes caeruleus subsp. caeruleus]|uniref:Lipoprotein n=2 Tax=Couchioplanes caeruleus TaxID=56438 RepID=A0A1K0GIM4_9ACTN|nr:hypothetical protein BG844_30110 [Couchioplanes caeruleus subsp. caeruleus]
MGVALGLTGCGPEDTAKTPTGAAGASAEAPQAASKLDPAADLAAAAKKLADQSMKFDLDMSGQMTMTGVADTKARLTQVSMSMTALGGDKIEMRMIKDDLYLKLAGSLGAMLGGKGGGKAWMHLDASKLSEGSNFNLSPNGDDPAGTQAMISSLTQVERVGDTGFKGTLDLSKSPRFKKGAAGLGDKLTKIPFTAKKDGEGRLVELTLDMSSLGAGAGKMKTTYHDFGTPVSVEAPPASEVQEMPSQLSGILNA